MSQTILVVDDEDTLRKNVAMSLTMDSYYVIEARNGSEALEALRKGGIDLVLLDVGLPDCNGFQLLHEIRLIAPTPVIFITGRDQEQDRIVGLEQGGDDYLPKPFSLRELVARVRAVLRRTYGPALSAFVVPTEVTTESDHPEPFVLDEDRRQVLIYGTPIDLTPSEFTLLKVLSDRAGMVYSRDQLLNYIEKDCDGPTDRVVDTHIKSLRAKMRAIAPHIQFILTRWGHGYTFMVTT